MRYAVFSVLVGLGCSGAASADQFVGFRSPSNNIHCLMSSGDWNGVRCDIGNFTPSYADSSCDLDFGFAFEVGPTGSGFPVCAGDTVRDDSNPVLNYGQRYTFGGVTCVSETTGMTCTNASGRGFYLSRARQRVF